MLEFSFLHAVNDKAAKTSASAAPVQSAAMANNKPSNAGGLNASSADSKSATAVVDSKPVTSADMKWLWQFQRNVIIFGHIPDKEEERRYNHIYNMHLKNNQQPFNEDLHWAYTFLMKTKNGYNPSAGELTRYESIVGNNINAQNTRQNANDKRMPL